MKFPVHDAAAIESRLLSLGATHDGMVSQLDRYFNHPCRDFAVTDEALRLRQVGDTVELTYKGPRVDTVTKTRRECSLPLATPHRGDEPRATVEAWTEALVALGFRAVAEVSKQRRGLSVDWESHPVEVAIDTVGGLGTYVEIEVLTDEAGVEAARACVASLARELGLSETERRSYLELLIDSRADGKGEAAGPP